MPDPTQLVSFYEEAYSHEGPDAMRYARWRALSALRKADHVVELCRTAAVRPARTLEVGCGDGALLCELHHRGFGGRLSGTEITPTAVSIARNRPEIAEVSLYDGRHLPMPDGSFDLGILSHVLEHVGDPAALLAEVARTCRAVLVELPLEANLSAARAGKREGAVEVGHLQRLDISAARAIAAAAGLSIACELEDPLALEVHRFFAATRRARLTATLKWALRTGTFGLAPRLARRLFTVHYAFLCLPDG